MSTIPTVAVSIILHEQDGSPIEGAEIEAKLETLEKYQGFVVPDLVEGIVTDATGTAVLNLFPNELGSESSEYRFKISHPSGRTDTIYAVVPNFDCELHNITELDHFEYRSIGAVITKQIADDVADAKITKAVAEESAAISVEARDETLLARTDVLAAQQVVATDKATVADLKTQAEAARDTSVTAANEAVGVRDILVAARDEAVAASSASVNAANTAIAESEAAGTAKTAAEAAAAQTGLDKNSVAADKVTVISAKDEAVAAKQDLDTAVTTVTTAKDATVTAKTEAEAAATTAVTAKNAAVAAKQDVDTAVTTATTAKDAAVTAKTDAEAAATTAVGAKDTAVTSATTATTKATEATTQAGIATNKAALATSEADRAAAEADSIQAAGIAESISQLQADVQELQADGMSSGKMACFVHRTMGVSPAYGTGWFSRPLNIEEYNTIDGCVFDASTSSFTLQEGTYVLEARVGVYKAEYTNWGFYDLLSDSFVGITAQVYTGGTNQGEADTTLMGVVTFAAPVKLVVRQISSITTNSHGLGVGRTNTPLEQTYTTVRVSKR